MKEQRNGENVEKMQRKCRENAEKEKLKRKEKKVEEQNLELGKTR